MGRLFGRQYSLTPSLASLVGSLVRFPWQMSMNRMVSKDWDTLAQGCGSFGAADS